MVTLRLCHTQLEGWSSSFDGAKRPLLRENENAASPRSWNMRRFVCYSGVRGGEIEEIWICERFVINKNVSIMMIIQFSRVLVHNLLSHHQRALALRLGLRILVGHKMFVLDLLLGMLLP